MPVAMLIQCLGDSRLRLGFRARPADPWFLSEIYGDENEFGFEIGQFGIDGWSTANGRMYGAGRGADVAEVSDGRTALSGRTEDVWHEIGQGEVM